MQVPHIPAPAVLTPLTKIQKLDDALRDLAIALNGANGLRWAVHGSCAALIRGASAVVPGDIDVAVSSIMFASSALMHSKNFVRGHSYQFLTKFTHTNGTDVDLADSQDFMPHFEGTAIQGVNVFTVPEVIISLVTRPQIRDKERQAFSYLVRKNRESLSGEDKTRIVDVMRLKFNKMDLTWDDVVAQAHDIKKSLKAQGQQTAPTEPTQNRLPIPTADSVMQPFRDRRQQKLATLPRRPGKGV